MASLESRVKSRTYSSCVPQGESNTTGTSASEVVDGPGHDADRATKDDAEQREVSASAPTTSEDAIRLAAKLAIDAGEYKRARVLLDVLEEKPRSAAVVPLASRRPAP